jgi:hypothetical protein
VPLVQRLEVLFLPGFLIQSDELPVDPVSRDDQLKPTLKRLPQLHKVDAV